MLKKSVTLLATLLVTVGGSLAFTSFSAKAQQSTRTVIVLNKGLYVADLCLKNLSQNNIEVCTGKIPLGSQRDLTILWNPGDNIIFITAVAAGKNAYYGPIAGRDTHCWSDGISFRPTAYCRMSSEAPHGN